MGRSRDRTERVEALVTATEELLRQLRRETTESTGEAESPAVDPNGSASPETVPQTGTDSNFGGRLRSVRGRATIKEFADQLGVGKNSLIRYESGERSPDADFVARVCQLFDVDPRWLVLGAGDPPLLSHGDQR